jgi:hypothetical protein
MTFDIYTPAGLHFIQYFETIDDLLRSMKNNPADAYHRKLK